MDKIKTATGKEFDTDYVATIPSPPMAYIRILNTPLTTVAAVFSNPAETIQLYYSGVNAYIAQHTKLTALVPEGNAIKVILAKE